MDIVLGAVLLLLVLALDALAIVDCLRGPLTPGAKSLWLLLIVLLPVLGLLLYLPPAGGPPGGGAPRGGARAGGGGGWVGGGGPAAAPPRHVPRALSPEGIIFLGQLPILAPMR